MPFNDSDDDAVLDALTQTLPGTIIVGYALVVNFIDETGDDKLVFAGLENQRATTTIGLLQAALEVEKSKFRLDG
jgi:hypothetical protein